MQRVADRLLPESREQLLQGQTPFLDSAKLKLVDGCNLRCFMCDYWKRQRAGELDTDAWIAVLDDLAALGCRKVTLSGGEPFLRPDLLDIAAHAVGLGMRVNLTTNGTSRQKGKLKALLKLPIRSVTVSIDGPVAHVHDEVRGVQGAWRSSLRFLDRALERRSHRTRVRVNTVVSRRNAFTLAEFPDLLRDRPIDGWLLIPMDREFNGRPDGGADEALSVEEIQRWNARVAPILAERVKVPGFDAWPFGRSEEELALAAAGAYARGHYRSRRCWVPWFHVLVGPTGDVYPCCGTHRRVPRQGNVLDTPLRELLGGEAQRSFRLRMLEQRLAACHQCDDFLLENRVIDEALAR